MGKSQKKKRATTRHNPVRVPDNHLPPGLAAAKSATPAEKAAAVLPIIQKMNSVDAGDRTWACAAISNLIQNDPGTRRLLQGKNVVGNLITRLSDNVEEVVVEASGALRNLCIDGGVDVCGEMFNKNILAPLRTCIGKISTTIDRILSNAPVEPSEISSRKLVYEFAENVITIIWCLSETSPRALQAINTFDLTPFLLSFIVARARIPLNAVTAAAQCLYVLTDVNPLYIDSVRSSGTWVNALIEVARPPTATVNGTGDVNGAQPEGDAMKQDVPAEESAKVVELRVLACGILRNICPLPFLLPAAALDIDQVIVLPAIIPLLEISLPDTAAAALELQKHIEYKPPSAKAPKNDHRTPEQRELDAIERRLRTLQLGLEILTGVCAVIPEEERVEEPLPPVNGTADDEDDDDMSAEEADPATEVPPTAAPPLPSVLHTLLSLPPVLLSLLPPTPLSYCSPSPVPPITSALRLVHLRALEALGNLLLGAAAFGAPIPISVRNEVWRVVWEVVQGADVELVGGGMAGEEVREAGVGVLWACLEGAQGVGGQVDVIPDTTEKLISICESSRDEATKAKCVASLASLGQRRSPSHIPENTTITAYLFRPFTPPLATSLPAPLLLAHMHAIIDMYSDETSPCDVVFAREGCLELMEGARAWLAKEVRRWKGREREEGRGMVREWGRFCEWREMARVGTTWRSD